VIALADAARVLARGLETRTYSAVSAEIGRSDGPIWSYAAGRLGFDSHDGAVESETIFDLASLTKVLATTTIAFELATRNLLDIDAHVSGFLPGWSDDARAAVVVRDLLEHSAGLPGYRAYFRTLSGPDAFLDAIAAEPLEYPPRTQAIYSDLGFIALGGILEAVGRASLAYQFREWKSDARIDAPLDYLPPAEWRWRTVKTGHDPWRARVLQGEVHDENAAALGGVAAHAGLFGTAGAVGAAARWWIEQFASALGRQFTTRSAVPGSSRALGWDTMLPTSSCGTKMSPRAVGHTGFTGTSVWIDPARDCYFVLLTNRVHASGSNEGIQQVRRDFHDAANAGLP
jgi:CubicO group peptidase (beta-lactamase class C family)